MKLTMPWERLSATCNFIGMVGSRVFPPPEVFVATHISSSVLLRRGTLAVTLNTSNGHAAPGAALCCRVHEALAVEGQAQVSFGGHGLSAERHRTHSRCCPVHAALQHVIAVTPGVVQRKRGVEPFR